MKVEDAAKSAASSEQTETEAASSNGGGADVSAQPNTSPARAGDTQGADRATGLSGTTIAVGLTGLGADTFVISDGPGTVRILDFGEGDTLDFRAFGLSGTPTFTQSGSSNSQIALDADTFVIVEGYLPAELNNLLNDAMNSSSIVL